MVGPLLTCGRPAEHLIVRPGQGFSEELAPRQLAVASCPRKLASTETLTLLFTDVEGSTRLLRRLGDEQYAKTMKLHNELVRSALAAHEGREVGTEGDSLFAVFPSAHACLEAAVEIQRALGAEHWPSGEELRVRMGIHSGEVSESAETGFVGLAVNRAARIAAVAHGGQVVLSETAASLVRDSLPPGCGLKELGRHRLKDLGRPEEIFQLEAEGLRRSFPPLSSLDSSELPNNLPSYLSTFVGRAAELREVRSLLETNRLVTLAGVGGSGKTRLALQVAAEHLEEVDGVFFVDLSVLDAPEQVPAAVLSAFGVPEEVRGSSPGRLVEALEHQRVLIVLDTCEHVIDACARTAELLGGHCPGVRLLATSREPLGIEGENVYRLGPLSLPGNDVEDRADLEGSDAVGLFVERARAQDRTFSVDDSSAGPVASICRRLDGIPLAIELAAARLATMSPEDLLGHLDHRFRLVAGGSRTAAPRHRTLEATLDWSYDLLTAEEQELFCRLAVFSSSFDLAAAEAVVGDETDTAELLGSLVTKSLVVAERSKGSLRYRLLDTMRDYGEAHLLREGGEDALAPLKQAHVTHFLALVEEAAPHLLGPEQGTWLRRLDLDWANLREAMRYCSTTPDGTEEVLRFGVALCRYVLSRGRLEPVALLRSALERAKGVPEELRASALLAEVWLLMSLLASDRSEVQRAVGLGEEALDLARRLRHRRLEAEVLFCLAWCSWALGEPARARELANDALDRARELDDPRLVGLAYEALAWATPSIEDAQAMRLQALDLLRSVGDGWGVVWELEHLQVGVSLDRRLTPDRRLELSRPYLEEAVAIAEEIGDTNRLFELRNNLATLALLQGDFDEAALGLRRQLLTGRRTGRGRVPAWAIFGLSCCAEQAGDNRRAAQLLGAFDVLDVALSKKETLGAWVWTPLELELRDQVRARLVASLGPAPFEHNYEIGRRLSLEEACDLALGRVEPR